MNDKEPGYRSPWLYSLLVIVGWGLVPYLAKAANFAGGFTTLWVNLSAAVGVLVIMAAKGYLGQFKAPRRLYRRFIVISVVWPLIYSISYFSIINNGSGSLATLLNYLWPLFAIALLSRTMKIPRIGIGLAIAGSIIVAGTVMLEGNLKLSLLALLLGLATPLTQAYFNVGTSDEKKYPGEYAWLLTFIGAVVTAAGAAIYILMFEHGQFTLGATVQDLLPLAIIGVGGNSIGFYAFLRAGQLSRTPDQKVWFILAMFLVPFAQVVFLVLGIEKSISPLRLISIALVAVGLLAFKLWESRQHKSKIAE